MIKNKYLNLIKIPEEKMPLFSHAHTHTHTHTHTQFDQMSNEEGGKLEWLPPRTWWRQRK